MLLEWLQKGCLVDSLTDDRRRGTVFSSQVYMNGYSFSVKWPDKTIKRYWVSELTPHVPLNSNDILKDLL